MNMEGLWNSWELLISLGVKVAIALGWSSGIFSYEFIYLFYLTVREASTYLHLQGPRGLLGPRGSPGIAGQRVSTTTHHSVIPDQKFRISLRSSSLIPGVCRDFLELTDRLVPKETW